MRPTYRGTATLLIEQGKIEGRLDRGGLQPGLDPARVLPDAGRDPQERGARAQGRRRSSSSRRIPTSIRARPSPGWSARLTGSLIRDERRAHRGRRRSRRSSRRFKRDLQVQLVRNSQLVQISFIALRPGARREGAQRAGRDVHRERSRGAHGDDAEGRRVAARAHGRAAREGRCVREGAAGLSRSRAHRRCQGPRAVGREQAARGAHAQPGRGAAEARGGRERLRAGAADQGGRVAGELRQRSRGAAAPARAADEGAGGRCRAAAERCRQALRPRASAA